MQPRSISPRLSVSPQITTDEVAEAKDLGFRAIICNRPDGEEPGQPTFQEIEAAAQELGLPIRHIPIIPGMMTDADATEFRNALADMPGPILAYCRSGARSAALWTLSQDSAKR
jgi:sulfide:quinone oxidoreductase